MSRLSIAATAFLFAGCASAPARVSAPDAERGEERPAVQLASAYTPPGHMDVTWTPPQAEEPKELRPYKVRDPLFASKQRKSPLFALPTRRPTNAKQ